MSPATPTSEPIVAIPVVYGGEWGPDLEEIARLTGLSPAEVVARHAAGMYRVEMMGFTPGFAYLGPLDTALVLPRRPTPRTLVPAGSVAIAGARTGVYPQAGPGGWHVIGRTPAVLFDSRKEPPTLLAPGDWVRFQPVERADFPEMSAELPYKPSRPALSVLRPGWLTTVQDAGRPGYEDRGIAPAGAVDAASLARANRLAGNPPGVAALEITGAGPRLRALRSGRLAIAGAEFALRLNGQPLAPEGAFEVERGDELDIGYAGSGWRCYLAIRGGIDVPLIMGSRSTHLQAGFGGLSGRALQRGDIIGRNPLPPSTESPPLSTGGSLRDPPLPAGSVPLGLQGLGWGGTIIPSIPSRPVRWRALLQAKIKTLRFELDPDTINLPPAIFTVLPASNRMGLRLLGPELDLPPPAQTSRPVDQGTIQLDGHGQPLILLNERGTTGGYARLGRVIPAEQWLLGQLRPGDRVRLAAVLTEYHEGEVPT